MIDSIAFPFKEGIDARQRTGLLFRLMAELQQMAVEKQIAVSFSFIFYASSPMSKFPWNALLASVISRSELCAMILSTNINAI